MSNYKKGDNFSISLSEARVLSEMERKAENIRTIKHEAMEQARRLREAINNANNDFNAEEASNSSEDTNSSYVDQSIRKTLNASRLPLVPDFSDAETLLRRNKFQNFSQQSYEKQSTRQSYVPELPPDFYDFDNENDEFSNDNFYDSNYSVDKSNGKISLANKLRHYHNLCQELELKLRETLILHAQVDNEKLLLRYELELVRDYVEDLADSLLSYQRLYTEKKKEWSYQRMHIEELHKTQQRLEKALVSRDRLLEDNGLKLISATVSDDDVVNNFNPNSEVAASSILLLPHHLLDRVAKLCPASKLEESLSDLLNAFQRFKERQTAQQQQSYSRDSTPPINRTTISHRRRPSGLEESPVPDFSKELDEWKKQYTQSQSKIFELQNEIKSLNEKYVRMENQMKRYKNISESLEKAEDESKSERRKLQKEAREANTRADDLKGQLDTAQRRLQRLNSFSRGCDSPTSK